MTNTPDVSNDNNNAEQPSADEAPRLVVNVDLSKSPDPDAAMQTALEEFSEPREGRLISEEDARITLTPPEGAVVTRSDQVTAMEPSDIVGELPIEQSEDGSRYDLKGSPRWNNAAHQATAKGLRPGSHEWMEDIRETLRQMPDLNRKPKGNHSKKERAGQPNQAPRAPRQEAQERRGERSQGQGKKGQGSVQDRRERPQGGSSDYSPAFVNYSAIVSMLLKASRFRRNQYLRNRGEIRTPSDLRDCYAVTFGGAPQSGKTKFLFERFMRDWSTSIYIAESADHVAKLKQLAAETMKEGQLNEMMKRVVTAQDVLADINKYTGPIAADARPVLKIDVDPNDANPAATLSSYVAAYMEEQRAFKEHEPPATHPTLLPLKTVYVDGLSSSETRNLTFGRLARYVRMGGQTPELIICQH